MLSIRNSTYSGELLLDSLLRGRISSPKLKSGNAENQVK